MKSRYLLKTALLFFVLTAVVPVAAQIVPRVNLYSSYTNNLFQTYNQQSSWINHVFIDLDYAPRTDLNLYYSGSTNVFSEYEDLFSHTHRTGVSYMHSGENLNTLHAGGELALRLDRPLYDYRDFLQAETYVNAKAYLKPTLLSRSGYSLRYQEYLNAGDYSFFEQVLFAQLSQFLPSRTTLQARAKLGLKTYARDVGSDTSTVPVRAGSDRNLVQLVSRLKIAQSLGNNTGLQLEYRRRANLAGQSRYAQEELYNPDDDLFDDHYSYSGDELRTTLKHLAPWGLLMELTGRSEQRNYEGRPALDLEGFLLAASTTREDTRNTLALTTEKTFYLEEGRVREIRLQLEWLYRDIQSNDAYYQTDSQVYSTGVQIDF
jgi:hypothetical protein